MVPYIKTASFSNLLPRIHRTLPSECRVCYFIKVQNYSTIDATICLLHRRTTIPIPRNVHHDSDENYTLSRNIQFLCSVQIS